MSIEERFYGRGASFPFGLGGRGGIRESTGLVSVEESLRIVIGTQHGERVMRPDFGCNLQSLTFAPQNDATVSMAGELIRVGLARCEPRVEVVDVRIIPGDATGVLVAHIDYFLRSTQEAGTLVHPFYLEAA